MNCELTSTAAPVLRLVRHALLVLVLSGCHLVADFPDRPDGAADADGDADSDADGDADSDGDDCLEPLAVSCGAPNDTGVAGIAAGSAHTCVWLVNGEVWCWGKGTNGRLGNGSAADSETPVRVNFQAESPCIVGVTTGQRHTCAWDRDGGAWCWGNDQYGQIGDGTPSDDGLYPSPLLLNDVVGVVAGNFHTCAWKRDGSAWCWGANGTYQLGSGEPTNLSLPKRVESLEDVHVDGMAAGWFNSCAWQRGGAARCWGSNLHKQLGDVVDLDVCEFDSPSPCRYTPDAIPGLVDDVEDMAVGQSHICALRTGGEVYCWGDPSNFRLGVDAEEDQPTPRSVTELDEPIFELTSYTSHTCARTCAGDQVWCWGADASCQLGLDIATPGGRLPGEPNSLSNSVILSVGAGEQHTCAVLLDTAIGATSVLCWGACINGRLGSLDAPECAIGDVSCDGTDVSETWNDE